MKNIEIDKEMFEIMKNICYYYDINFNIIVEYILNNNKCN